MQRRPRPCCLTHAHGLLAVEATQDRGHSRLGPAKRDDAAVRRSHPLRGALAPAIRHAAVESQRPAPLDRDGSAEKRPFESLNPVDSPSTGVADPRSCSVDPRRSDSRLQKARFRSRSLVAQSFI